MNERTESIVPSQESGEPLLELEASHGVEMALAEAEEILAVHPQTGGSRTGVVETIAERLQATPAEVGAAQEEIGFVKRQAELQANRSKAFDKLQAQVRNTLLSVLTATALQGASVRAESPTTPERTSLETVLIGKVKSLELSYEEVFDTTSPLNIASEKIRKKPLIPEEIVFLRELRQKTLTDRNEWAVLAGRDKTGKLAMQLFEGHADGVTFSFAQFRTEGVKDMTITHTHPLTADQYQEHGQTKGEGATKKFIYPPSATDIKTCLLDSDVTYRVVDPYGVWAYQCDKNHPLVVNEQVSLEKLKNDFMTLGVEYHIATEDMTRILAGVKMISRWSVLPLVTSLLSLESKYPGLDSAGTKAINVHADRTKELTQALLRNDEWVEWILRNANQWTETELGWRLQSLIQNAERSGVHMSFTPFKGELRQETRK